ncbi:hypothetical protein Ato02nite_040370 [Paractinoplanes toevensis]|uniref:Uncharacterized protein n=1 Tax=Paractinoplanes toevensis TaxID=571911 RepID=A0A919TA62_9ACTN|nr:hypothetical protein Ato02nite_040370 [Actinoplanes toevensis]
MLIAQKQHIDAHLAIELGVVRRFRLLVRRLGHPAGPCSPDGENLARSGQDSDASSGRPLTWYAVHTP